MRFANASSSISAAFLCLSVLTAATASGQSATGTLGIYFDPMETQCNGTILPGVPGTIYILAKLEGTSASGITGAEFRIGGIPETWDTHPVPNPVMISLGDPFTIGVTGAFGQCQRPDNGVVILYTVLVVASDQASDLVFTLESRNPPSNPYFPCPLILLCDSPRFSKVCVEAQTCSVNATVARKCAAPTAVNQKTWGGVKGLYRKS